MGLRQHVISKTCKKLTLNSSLVNELLFGTPNKPLRPREGRTSDTFNSVEDEYPVIFDCSKYIDVRVGHQAILFIIFVFGFFVREHKRKCINFTRDGEGKERNVIVFTVGDMNRCQF